MYRILIVEDDEVITDVLCAQMAKWGFESIGIRDFQHVLEEFNAFDPQLVLMDITLPFYDGYHWCSEIRKVSSTPIIFISSASESMNILMALNAGADDFIAKPFDMTVLIAKVQALLRRVYDFAPAVQPLIRHGALTYNPADGTVAVSGQRVELSKNEARILSVLLQHQGKIVSRELLMTSLWETDAFVDENTLTVNVTRLRKRLEAAGINELIKTRKGMGYIVE